MKYFLMSIAMLMGVVFLSACAPLADSGRNELVRASAATAPVVENALGRSQFLLCSACHGLSASGPATLGPHLEGIIGRRAAGLPDFAYSDLLRAEDVVWTAELLDQWLENPDIVAPNMCMPFNGIADAQARKALIDYFRAAP